MERNFAVNELIIDIIFILLLLSLAKTLEAFLRYIHVEPYISWFIAGMIINLIISDNVQLQYLESTTRLTAMFIVFLTGLSIDIEFLRYRAKNGIIIGTIGVISTFTLSFIVFYTIIRINIPLSLIFSIILSNTASEMVLAVTQTIDHLDVRDYAIGASIFDDMLAIVSTSMYLIFVNPISTINNIVIGLLIIITMTILIYILRKIHMILRKDFLLSIFTALLFLSSAIAIYVKFSEILISFLLGLTIKYISRGQNHLLRYATIVSELKDGFEKILNIFLLPIFFASFGLMIDIENVNLVNMVIIVLVITIGKVLGCSIPGYHIIRNRRKALELGIIMNLRGFLENTLLFMIFIQGYIDITFYSTIAIVPIIVTIITLIVIQILRFHS